MSGLPIVCDSCGHRGLVRGLIEGSAANAQLAGNRTNCPQCGGWARIVDGTYAMADSVFTMTSGSDQSWREFVEIMSDDRWTQDRLERIARALASPGHGGKPEHVVEQVKRQDKEFGDWLGRFLADPRMHGAAAILMPIVIAILTGLLNSWGGDDAPPPQPTITQIVNQTVEVHTERTPIQGTPPGDTEPPMPISTDPPR